jgi:hypothetical protein
MHNIYLIIIIIIIIIFVIIIFSQQSEHFDQRVDGATKEQCGIMCTKILGCGAFAYDENNKYCYLSKDDILFSPEKKSYSAYYNRKFPRCNKLYKITDPYYNSRNNIIQNSTYKCMGSEGGTPEYKIYDNKEKDKINIDKLNLEEISPYTFERIEWTSTVPVSDGRFNTDLQVPVPSIKSEIEQDPDNAGYYGSWRNITKSSDEINDNRFSGTKPIYDPITATPNVSIESSGSINLDKNLHLVTNPTKTTAINIMKQYDDEFAGQYMYPHKCSTNIKKEDCMKQCLGDKDCVGTEWNPILFKKVGTPNKYEFDENVCCPKIRIKKVVPRRHEMRFGHFYLKEPVSRNYLQEGEILVGLNKDKKDNVTADLGEKYGKWKNNMY